MQKGLQDILAREHEEQLLRKQQRQQKASLKFSKQRFMRTGETKAEEKLEETGSDVNNLNNLIKRNLKVDLVETLSKLGVDFLDAAKNISWLNLSFYDHKDHQRIPLLEGEASVSARALFTSPSLVIYRHGVIKSYSESKNKYFFSYEDGEKIRAIWLPRIYLCCDTQDPHRYCDRVVKAFLARIYADNLIRLEAYVQKMPTEGLSRLEEKQRQAIKNFLGSQKKSSETSLQMLYEQVQQQYWKTMNTIILKKHLTVSKQELVPAGLIVNLGRTQKQAPQYGLVSVDRDKEIVVERGEIRIQKGKTFLQSFEQFCQHTIHNEKNVILSLQLIRNECQKVGAGTLSKIQQGKMDSIRFEQYQSEQNSFIQRSVSKLRSSWVNSVKQIIETHFKKGQVPWFNFNIDAGQYQYSKMKKYFRLVRYIMEDALRSLAYKSLHGLVEQVEAYLPERVQVNSIYSVVNYYQHGLIISSGQSKGNLSQGSAMVTAMFETDLMRAIDDSCFNYATPINNFISVISTVFNRLTEQLNKVPQVQDKLLLEVFKKEKQEKCLTVWHRGETKPGQIDQDVWLKDLYARLKRKLDDSLMPLDQYLKQFNELVPILQMKPEEIIKKIDLEDEQHPKEIQTLKEEIEQCYTKERDMILRMPDCMRIGVFKIHIKEIVQHLALKHHQVARGLQGIIAKKAKKSIMALLDKFRDISKTIEQNPSNIEKLVELRDYMIAIPSELEKMKKEIEESNKIYQVLDEFKYIFGPEDIRRRYAVMVKPRNIKDEVEKKKKELEVRKVEFEDQLGSQQEEFKNTLESLSRSISQFHMHNKKDQHVEIAEKVEVINTSLAHCLAEAKKFNSRENLFDKDLTDYSRVQQMAKDFLPYSHLWRTTTNWLKNIDVWLYGEWNMINAEECERFVEDAIKDLVYAIRYFKDKEIVHILKIAESVKVQIDQLRPKVPLLVALRKPGLRDRHWIQLQARVGFPIKPDEHFTFSKVLSLGLLRHIDTCIQISQQASKQFAIENNLKQMLSVWDNVSFSFAQYKTGLIVKNFDQVVVVVDDHIANTQSMLFSPFKKPFEQKIMEWFNGLKNVSDIAEQWTKLQMNWMYLQPIFDSADIAKQLHKESKSFKLTDNFWRSTLFRAREVGNVWRFCQTQNLLQEFRESNNALDTIQKSLNNYLESKRAKFARFYFLSNNELLEILSQAKQPLAVQPYLKKVFENISEVQFDQSGKKQIISMLSAEQEKVHFDRPIDPKGKNVQDWMTELEELMKQSIRSVLLHAIKDYKIKKREQWVLDHPGQCVLNGSQVNWTFEVEERIAKQNIQNHFSQLTNQLNTTVQLVRQKLSRNQSITLNALIVIDVHARDVVGNLHGNNVEDANAFEWISQLRYYWQGDNCVAKCVQTVFPYGYQYLGNTLRLVITPLTDKCYMTLMGALKLNLGGAPAGPAGTGKTETTKDLAKALAKQCVVFNCSDSMDFIMVGKFFKGLAAAGAWACFDQFNRINIEVLSVIAQQLLILFGQKAKGSLLVEFEGSEIKLQPTFSVFITMNPGYAGRTQLPDNLKALFRPVALMVPDYAMIGQIMLYSFGFKNGRQLAKKMVVTFRLASEQLSSQDHYDYGMRAVRSVINAAGILKEKNPDFEEDKLLLRALRDVNVPKFLKDDLPLFENIIQDLFPGVEKPIVDHGLLLERINRVCQQSHLQATNIFVGKVIQLYDTIQVRHGLMLVGSTGGGKTESCGVLRKALTSLQSQGYYKVNAHVINPKAITMGQLYGMFNQASREWIDGVLAYTVQKCCTDRTMQKHWVMFDGPVDALWIENMNTVLDDNKKLCLNSGQILILTPHMTMMFQVEDLAVASPATVSRCGMVYLQPAALGVTPLSHKWRTTLPAKVKQSKKVISIMQDILQTVVYPLLQFTRKHCKQLVATIDQNLLQSYFRNLDCYLRHYVDTEVSKVTAEDMLKLQQTISKICIFCIVWSIGATTDHQGRAKFNDQLRVQLNQRGHKQLTNFYEHYFNNRTGDYQPWTSLFDNYDIPSEQEYHEILVPTVDSTRWSYLTKMLLQNNSHVMVPGATGTGKSLNAYSLLTEGMGEIYQYIPISFSAQTSANQTQDTIDLKLQKIKRGVFGAPLGRKYIVFIDDLNMPKKEEFGAQPPIELLRQFLDHSGWYNRKDQQFMKIESVILLTALGPPGGGRTHITPRIIRHFNVMANSELDGKTVSRVFNIIVGFFLKRFSEQVKDLVSVLVESVLAIYQQIRLNLLPTPKKSHYTFNLRDISKVFQGICSASPKHCNSRGAIVQLWHHEMQRVFGDRLINQEDKLYLLDRLEDNLAKFSWYQDTAWRSLIFCDFLQGRQTEPRHYMQAPDYAKLMAKIVQYQDEYNNDPKFSGARGKNAMRLIYFQDACEHICRIVRIIRQPMGNALLLGVGGSGRQSLAKMGIFIANHVLKFIEVVKNYGLKSWRQDLKIVLMETGLQHRQTSFLLADTQIIQQQMIEDINSVLNSGDVAGLYNQKDMEDILMACKSDCLKKGLQPNKMNIFGQYLARIKQNIHIVLAMSPLSQSFSTRLRMFPSLVNCCILDWFGEWPEEALMAVGVGQLSDFLEQNQLLSLQSSIIQVFKTIHKSVETSSIRYFNELRRYNYVTPMSYLQLLVIFKMVLRQKQFQLKNSINRLKTGLDKLTGANAEVVEMQVQLKDLQPQLERSAIETIELMKQIEVEKSEAKETERVVSKEQAQAKIQTQEALQIAREVDIKVQDANAKLAESLRAVDKLKTDNIVEIKSLKTPSKTALTVLGGCVIFFQDMITSRGHEIILRKVQGTTKKEEDWMNTARIELLDNPKVFLEQLKGYDRQHINQGLIAKFNQKIMKQPDFTFEKAKSAGVCIQALYQWQMAMYNFNQIYLDTRPLREKEAEVKKLVAEKTTMLRQKKKLLSGVIQKIASLEKAYTDCITKKDQLTKTIQECEVKLDRAKKLTSGLSGEKQRWTKEILRLEGLTKYIPGNSILSAATISYGGAFTAAYRTGLQEIWAEKINEVKIEIEAKTSLVNFLGTPVTIQQWTMAGLPKDENSIENGLIIQKTRRWALMIDPQGQANKFIKTMGREWHLEGIDVVKEKEDAKLMKTLELAIQNGKWFLLENVGQQLAQSLEPILLQQVTRSGGSSSITLGDKTLGYNEHFKMFMTTTLPNPHYSPETFVKVTIINFAITPQGLEDQMLAELVALENPQLEQKKRDIVKRNATDQKELLSIEDSILQSLSQGSGGVAELLLDETLINQLQNSKKFASEINQRIQDSRATEQQIDKTREGYRSVAYRASVLFFCIIDLSGIDPMYQYSLQWFINLFKMAIENALSAKELEVRLNNLITYFTYSLYENVCRSLFEKHKLLFSFMLTAKIEFGKKQMDPLEWRYFLAGPAGDLPVSINPTTWISDSSWPDIFRQLQGMQDIPALKGIFEEFMQHSDNFRGFFTSNKPHQQAFPEPWKSKLNDFQKLIVLKAIRLDKVIPGIKGWISLKLGKEFIVPPIFDLPRCFRDSTNMTPLIFLLSPGSDPVTDFLKFAKEMQKKTQSISLGQGQGPKAQELVRAGQLKGIWILLQNCHLAASWMSELQRIVEDFGENSHRQFRLWLTSMPTDTFPISVLQNSVKMTLQPPNGLRSNLLRSYMGISQEQFSSCQKPRQYRKLLFGFCFFHAIIQDRRKFGPIGWNIAYEFTNEDLNVCKRQLKMLLDEYTDIPYKVLNYLGAQINYGGRVTDDKDVRLIKTILANYITPRLFEVGYKFSKSGHYYAPDFEELGDYISYIENLPLNPLPEAFGMHDNAQITTAQNQTLSLLNSILSIQPRSNSGSGKAREQIIFQITEGIQSKTPQQFDLQAVMQQYPTDYNESMNTVLVQEVVRYNRLLEVMKSSLFSLKKALKGLVVMSEDLEKLSNSIYDNQVGKIWADKSFLSLKPLGSWIEDLNARIKFLTTWIQSGTPLTFWISGFFFPQAFVTGSMQNYARKKAIAIDRISFKFAFLDEINHHSEIKAKPQFNCYVYGIFLQGCRWNHKTHMLGESRPKELFSSLPMMHLIPCEEKSESKDVYQCPLYKVVSRSGTLSTTGHSTNFVMYIELPTTEPPKEWTCCGVGAFLSLRY